MTNNKQVVATGDAETITVSRAEIVKLNAEVVALRAEVEWLSKRRHDEITENARLWAIIKADKP